MTRTGADADAYAAARIGTRMPASGLCLQFTRQNFAVDALYASAIDAWNAATYKHTGDRNPPVAVPVYFHTPSQYRHVAHMSTGGTVITTNGDKIERWSSLAAIESGFRGPYMGWTEDLNATVVYPNTQHPDPTPGAPDMHYTSKTTSGPSPIPYDGKWYQLNFNNLAFGAAYFEAVTHLTVSGLPAGGQLAMRYVLVDVNSSGQGTLSSAFPTVELVGTAGQTLGVLPGLGSIPAGKSSSWKKALRVQVQAYNDGVRVESAVARMFTTS